MQEQNTSNTSNSHIQYYCTICDAKSNQISHHKAHLKTQKHIFKKKCFEQCLNMSIFHIYNTTNMDKKKIITIFEEDTNFKFIKNNEDSIIKFRQWRLNRQELLKEEFPNSIIPEHELILDHELMPDHELIPEQDLKSDNSEFLSNWFKKIIETNETVLKHKTNTSIQKITQTNTFKENIIKKTIDELINTAVDCQSEFFIATVLYKLNYDKFCFKSFIGNVWVDKSDTTILSTDILLNLRNQISITIKNLFEEFNKNLPVESENKKKCSLIIKQLVTTKMINKIIREVKEMFFNN